MAIALGAANTVQLLLNSPEVEEEKRRGEIGREKRMR
jgi:hypothetical protein